MFKALRNVAVIGLLSVGLSGCFWGDYAEVPLAHVGKIKTKDGLKEGLIDASQFRLPWCWAYCDKLLLAEISDFQVKESFRGDENSLYMPKSDLVMEFDVRGTFAVARDEGRLEKVFANLPAKPSQSYSGSSGVISANQVYQTYAVTIIRDVVRRVVANYTIEDISSNRGTVNAELNKALVAAFQAGKIPIDIRRFGLADVRYPKIILDQKRLAAQRRIAIQQEEAEKQIQLVKLQTELEKAKASRAIRREKAQAVAEENKILADSVNQKYLAFKQYEILEGLVGSQNTKWISPSIMKGLTGQIAAGTAIGNQK